MPIDDRTGVDLRDLVVVEDPLRGDSVDPKTQTTRLRSYTFSNRRHSVRSRHDLFEERTIDLVVVSFLASSNPGFAPDEHLLSSQPVWSRYEPQK
jgi:hypothetical protein